MQKVRMEKEARSKFLLDVLKSRREQIQLKRKLFCSQIVKKLDIVNLNLHLKIQDCINVFLVGATNSYVY